MLLPMKDRSPMKEANKIIARFCSPVKTEYGRGGSASIGMTGAVGEAGAAAS